MRHLHESLPLASMTHSRICDEFLFSGQTGSNCSCYFATRSLTRRMSAWPGPQPGCKTLTARDRSFNALVQHPLLQAGACYAATVSQHWCGRGRVGDRRPCLLQGSRWGGLPRRGRQGLATRVPGESDSSARVAPGAGRGAGRGREREPGLRPGSRGDAKPLGLGAGPRAAHAPNPRLCRAKGSQRSGVRGPGGAGVRGRPRDDGGGGRSSGRARSPEGSPWAGRGA